MNEDVVFRSTKTYTHAQGLSCAFRQWRAESHCHFIHGYALEVRITFQGELDKRNWVVDFGGLKELKAWLEEMFDHKTLVAQDDPMLGTFMEMRAKGVADVKVVEHIGIERFAEMIFFKASHLFDDHRVRVIEVEVSEHAGNSAICKRRY